MNTNARPFQPQQQQQHQEPPLASDLIHFFYDEAGPAGQGFAPEHQEEYGYAEHSDSAAGFSAAFSDSEYPMASAYSSYASETAAEQFAPEYSHDSDALASQLHTVGEANETDSFDSGSASGYPAHSSFLDPSHGEPLGEGAYAGPEQPSTADMWFEHSVIPTTDHGSTSINVLAFDPCQELIWTGANDVRLFFGCLWYSLYVPMRFWL